MSGTERKQSGSEKKRSIKACIFDLDGTLADSVHSIAFTGNLTLGQYGYAPLPEMNYNYYAGDGAKELVRRFLARARIAQEEDKSAGQNREGSILTQEQRSALKRECAQASASVSDQDEEFLAMYETYKELFAVHCMDGVKPFPGIPELLDELKRRNIRIAVFSNKPHPRTLDVIGQLFGPGYFDMVQGQEDGVPKKPSPVGARKIADAFGAGPEECCYLGDTDTDMQTGKNAGMFTAGVLWGFRDAAELTENRADILLREPLDLLFCLEQKFS